MNLTLLILAAGMGSRYGGLKQLDAVGPSGESIMDYSIYDAKQAGFNKIVFVIRKSLEKDFKEKIFPKYQNFIEIDYVFQEINDLPKGFKAPKERVKPWGTAHAVWVARNKIKENFAVINADDFYGATAYTSLVNFFINDKDNSLKNCLITYELGKTTSKNGSVSRGICQVDASNHLIEVVEHTSIFENDPELYSLAEDDRKIVLHKKTPTSMNLMGFNYAIFPFIKEQFIHFLEKNIHKTKSEFFLPDILTQLIKKEKTKIRCIPTQEQWFGITYKEDKKAVVSEIIKKIALGIYPKNLFK